MEYSKIFRNENGAEVEFRVKAECSTKEEMRKALSFIAQSSHQFYLETAETINSKLPAIRTNPAFRKEVHNVEIEDEKKEWLLQIGAKEFPEPIKYTYTFPGYSGNFNLSERYVKNTPLKDMKAQYEENKEYVNQVLEAKKSQDIFRQDAGHF